MLVVCIGLNDLDGFDVVVNVMLVGMKENDLLFFDVVCIVLSCFVGEVVMKFEYMLLLCVVFDKGCDV